MNSIFQFILSLLWFCGTTGFSFGAKEASDSSLINRLGFSQNGGERLAETRVYDKPNRLRSVAHLRDAALNAVAKSFTYSYNSANQRTRVDREDGTYWDYGYDALGHLTGAVKKQGDGTAQAGQHFAYQYDALGNRLSASFGGDAGGTGGLQTASYTASATGDRNQYAAITAPGVVLSTGKANLATAISVNGESARVRQGEFFSHQTPVSNSTGPVEIDITVTATTGGQSDSVTRREFVDAASRSLTHDADGNLIFDGYRDYTWDAENRLLSVQTRAGLVPAGGVEYRVAYAYDYAGRRIHRLAERKVGNAWYLLNQRSYLYDGWNVVAECSDTAAGARQVEQSYLWGLDISGTPQGAGGVGGLLAIEKHHGAQAGIHFASHDGNGNVVALTNAADGTLSASYEYDPFGNLLEMSGAFAAQNPYRFSTKRQDELTGFYDYGYRTYDPGTGRWLSRDPIQEDGGLNLYGFVGNDGVNGVDVLGFADLEVLQQYHSGSNPFITEGDRWTAANGVQQLPFENAIYFLHGYEGFAKYREGVQQIVLNNAERAKAQKEFEALKFAINYDALVEDPTDPTCVEAFLVTFFDGFNGFGTVGMYNGYKSKELYSQENLTMAEASAQFALGYFELVGTGLTGGEFAAASKGLNHSIRNHCRCAAANRRLGRNNSNGNGFDDYVVATKLKTYDDLGMLGRQERLPTPDVPGKQYVKPDYTFWNTRGTVSAYGDAKALIPGVVKFDAQSKGLVYWAATTESKTLIYYVPWKTRPSSNLFNFASDLGVQIKFIIVQ